MWRAGGLFPSNIVISALSALRPETQFIVTVGPSWNSPSCNPELNKKLTQAQDPPKTLTHRPLLSSLGKKKHRFHLKTKVGRLSPELVLSVAFLEYQRIYAFINILSGPCKHQASGSHLARMRYKNLNHTYIRNIFVLVK